MSYYNTKVTPESLIGHTLASLDDSGFSLTTGESFSFVHDQDCCECVEYHSTVGDPKTVIGKPLTACYEDNEEPVLDPPQKYYDSHTWTNFTFIVADGSKVVIRWLGESNGYYGEDTYIRKNP